MKKFIKKFVTVFLIATIILPNQFVMASNPQAVQEVKPQANTETKKETQKEQPKVETKKEEVRPQQAPETQNETKEEKVKESKQETQKEELLFNQQKNAILENVDQNTKMFGNVPNRQFMKIMTREGKVFYLLIEYDDIGEEVKLLTEVSDKDLLSLTDGQLESEIINRANQEVQKEEIKENDSNEVENINTTNTINNTQTESNTFKIKDIILILALVGTIGFMIYIYKRKKSNEYEEE